MRLEDLTGKVEISASKGEYTTYIEAGPGSWSLLETSSFNRLASKAADDVNRFYQAFPQLNTRIELGSGSFVYIAPDVAGALTPKAFKLATMCKSALSNARLLILASTKSDLPAYPPQTIWAASLTCSWSGDPPLMLFLRSSHSLLHYTSAVRFYSKTSSQTRYFDLSSSFSSKLRCNACIPALTFAPYVLGTLNYRSANI